MPTRSHTAWPAVAGLVLACAPAFAKDRDRTPRDFTLVFAAGSALTGLQQRLAQLDASSAALVFTGNCTTEPFPPEGAPGRARAEREARAHVAATADFVRAGGSVYFLPGDRDFPEAGTAAVLRLREFLNGAFADAVPGRRKPDVMPEAACGTVHVIALTERVGLILLNSQWWLQDRRADPALDAHCASKGHAQFAQQLREAYQEHRDRRLIVASHHPLLPAPFRHPMLRNYAEVVFGPAEVAGAFVFASGHDARLAHAPLEHQVQLIAGASSGWAEVAVGPSGEGEARLCASDGTPFFRAALPPVGLSSAPAPPPGPMPVGPVHAGFSRRSTWDPPGALQWLLGAYYRDAYALSLAYPVLDLETEQGGLTVEKLGGGRQTNTLHARDARGGEWRIRSTTKDPTRVLPYPWFRVEPALRALDYAYTAIHPEAALTLPRLSGALGLEHPRPRLMFLPDQRGLGAYRGLIADEVVLVEQRPGDGHKKFDKVVEKLRDRPDRHRLDQEAMLRARLLDVLVGDFDRGKNQWRFSVAEAADGAKTYRPVPLDRDQAFSHYDGAGLAVARLMLPEARKIQPFDGTWGPLAWQTFNSRDFDAVVLNGLSHSRWMAIAADVQAALTDAVIDEAMAAWHPEAFALDGARIAAALKQRRDGLLDAADGFYRVLSRRVDVVGSTHDDVFDLTFEARGAVRVTVRDRAAGSQPHYDRRFEPEQTQELRLYALAGDDLLSVHGRPHGAIEVRFVGDEGFDRVAAADPAGSGAIDASAITLYDTPAGAEIAAPVSVRDGRSTLAERNQYRPDENHAPDYGWFIPGIRASADGIAFGGTYGHVFHRFKKQPFAARHELSASAAIPTGALAFDYRGLFPESAELLDQELGLSLRSADHTENFFGYTNALTESSDDPDYYRVRQASLGARYGASFAANGAWARIGAQVLGQGYVTEATPNRFVSASADVAPSALGPTVFVGGRLFAEIDTFDRPALPRRGLALKASIEGRAEVTRGNQFSMTHRLAGTLAIPFDPGQRLVLITTARLEGILGEHPFFLAPTLGDGELRAYQPRQLAGDLAFAQTTDLRLDVWRIEAVLPGTVGVTASIDHGRVFGPPIGGDTWHLSAGGSVWWSIVDRVGVSVGCYRGLAGGSRCSLQVGSRFAYSGL